jgi:hypothetical protein
MEPSAAMTSVPPGDIESLRARLASFEAAQAQWEADRQELTLRIQHLEAQRLARAVARDARRSDPDARSLFDDAAMPDAADDAMPADAPVAVAPKRVRTTPVTARRRGRQPLDPTLPRVGDRAPRSARRAARLPGEWAAAVAGVPADAGGAGPEARGLLREALRAHRVGESGEDRPAGDAVAGRCAAPLRRPCQHRGGRRAIWPGSIGSSAARLGRGVSP